MIAAAIKDDLGRPVAVARLPARRIVSLTPAVTENLFAVGAGRLLVGVTTACDYPAQAKRITKVGDFYQPSVERIRALRPDVIIIDSATVKAADVDNLQARLKVPIFAQRSDSFDDVIRHLEQLGRITDAKATAARRIREMQAKASRAAKRVAGKRRGTVFVEVNATPLYTAGPGTFIDDLIRRAGGINVVKGTNPFPQYSREALLAANPEHYVITVSSDNMGRPSGKAAAAATLAPPLDRIAAARRGNVHRIHADLVSRPTPRLADGLLALAAALHP